MLLPFTSKLNTKRIILASASTRRQELLGNQLGLKFEVCVSDFEELLPHQNYKGVEGAARYAVDTAKGKVLDVYHKLTRVVDAPQGSRIPDLIIGADTVVEHAGDILEKPADADMARTMLSRLSGDLHHVHTGVVLALTQWQGDSHSSEPLIHTFSSTTSVQFDTLTDDSIQAYIDTGEPFGKAGSYGIQGMAATFVRSIDGDFFTVVGFPVHRFATELVALMEQGKLVL